MSQKRPAARDISDLKARLGLKKSSAKAPGAARPGGIVAPPGAAPAGIPAPPGAAPPQPQIPDASQDPFGAMNAMAAHSHAVRGPEIVVVNDGGPVESVERKARTTKYLIYGAMVMLPLAVGVGIGQVSAAAKQVNKAIDDSGKLHNNIAELHGGLINLNETVLLTGKERAGGKTFKLADTDLNKDLKAFEFPSVDPTQVYDSQLAGLRASGGKDSQDALLYENLLYFYDQSRVLRDMLRDHVARSEADIKAIKTGTEKLIGNTPQRYGAYISKPTEAETKAGMPPAIKLVELVSPACADPKQPPPCGGPPVGFRVREDGTAQVLQNVSFANANKIELKKLLLIKPTKVYEQAVMGGEASVAAMNYMARLVAIDTKTAELIEIGNALEATLKGKAKQSKRFTFFL